MKVLKKGFERHFFMNQMEILWNVIYLVGKNCHIHLLCHGMCMETKVRGSTMFCDQKTGNGNMSRNTWKYQDIFKL